jgi:FixJ family two-component response regulator
MKTFRGVFLFRYDDSVESLLQDEEIRFGCIVLNIGLSGMSGLDLLSELR